MNKIEMAEAMNEMTPGTNKKQTFGIQMSNINQAFPNEKNQNMKPQSSSGSYNQNSNNKYHRTTGSIGSSSMNSGRNVSITNVAPTKVYNLFDYNSYFVLTLLIIL